MCVGWRAPLLCVLVLAAGCEIERSGLRAGGERDAGPPGDAGVGSTDAGADAATDAGGEDAGPVDAGPPPMPTAIETLSTSGANHSHPAVVWAERRNEFVVAFLEVEGTGTQVSVARMRPGALPHARRTLTAGSPRPRRSLTLAAAGSEVAIGWSEHDGTEWTLDVWTLSGGPLGGFGPLEDGMDFDDAHLWWSDGTIFAAARQPDGAGERLASVSFDGVPSFEGEITGGPLGEIGAAPSQLLTLGNRAEVWRGDGSSWTQIVTADGLDDPVEGDVVELGEGSLFALWCDNRSTGRELAALSFDVEEDEWSQVGAPTHLGWMGPDPAIDVQGEGVVVAWPDTTDGGRWLGLGMLDAEGNVLVDRCHVPEAHAVTNDPDVACGGGWCAVVWLEAETYGASDFVTRLIQVPADPRLICP